MSLMIKSKQGLDCLVLTYMQALTSVHVPRQAWLMLLTTVQVRAQDALLSTQPAEEQYLSYRP